jgi:uncharacterized protein involved in type VI secretion and phage assembly
MIEMDILTDSLAPPDQRARFYGVIVGVVTNNQDPDGLGRVKVKFPWLSEEHESHWARLLTPMAGNERGLYCLPEVNDEVLVAFEHGQVEFPYVLGALWNGQDKPPEQNDDGQNNKRTLKSRSGHLITLDDTQGEEQIIIRDKTEKNEIVIASKDNTMTIRAAGDLTIEAKGKISLKSDSGDLSIEGQNLSLQAQQNCDLKANQNCQVQANAGLALKCMAGVKINDGALEVV